MIRITIQDSHDKASNREGKADVSFWWTETQRTVVTLNTSELDTLYTNIGLYRAAQNDR